MNVSLLTKFFLQLRYLQTLNSISAENNSTIIFPVPIDILSHLVSNRQVGGGFFWAVSLDVYCSLQEKYSEKKES